MFWWIIFQVWVFLPCCPSRQLSGDIFLSPHKMVVVVVVVVEVWECQNENKKISIEFQTNLLWVFLWNPQTGKSQRCNFRKCQNFGEKSFESYSRGLAQSESENNLKIGLKANSAPPVQIYEKILLNWVKSAEVTIQWSKLVQQMALFKAFHRLLLSMIQRLPFSQTNPEQYVKSENNKEHQQHKKKWWVTAMEQPSVIAL